MSALLRRSGFTTKKAVIWFLIFPSLFAVFCIRYTSFLPLPYIANGRVLWQQYEHGPGERLPFGTGTPLEPWMNVHLWSAEVAGVLLPLQFLPIVRRKYKTFHRYVGRLLFVLLLVANIGGIAIAHVSFGGTLETRIGIYTLGLMIFYALPKSWLAARRGDFAAHRVWAIRTWGWAGGILTMRIIMRILGMYILSPYTKTFHSVSSCGTLYEMYTQNSYAHSILEEKYPMCKEANAGGVANETYVAVPVELVMPEGIVSMLSVVFGTTVFFSIVLHLVGVEWWLSVSSPTSGRAASEKKK